LILSINALLIADDFSRMLKVLSKALYAEKKKIVYVKIAYRGLILSWWHYRCNLFPQTVVYFVTDFFFVHLPFLHKQKKNKIKQNKNGSKYKVNKNDKISSLMMNKNPTKKTAVYIV